MSGFFGKAAPIHQPRGASRMSRNQEGRAAGHHITPGQGWRWQKFGDKLMLVTDGGGADVVLSARHMGGGRVELTTCSPDGRMIPLLADSPLGLALAALPDLVAIARDCLNLNDRPRQLPLLEAALRKGGLL